MGEFKAPPTQGLTLFEVYEKSGALLLVTSSLADAELLPTDYVVRRPWATAAEAIPSTAPTRRPEDYAPTTQLVSEDAGKDSR